MSTVEPAQEPADGPEVAKGGLDPASFTEAVENMLTALLYSSKHDVLIHLAREYGNALDRALADGDDELLVKLGPKLESVCVRLGVRPANINGGEHGAGVSPLEAWRARRSG